MKIDSGNTNVRSFSDSKSVTAAFAELASGRRTRWMRGWYRCIEFSTICQISCRVISSDYATQYTDSRWIISLVLNHRETALH